MHLHFEIFANGLHGDPVPYIGLRDAMLELLNFFEKDMLKLSRYIQIPREDALQSMKLEMIELFKMNNEC